MRLVPAFLFAFAATPAVAQAPTYSANPTVAPTQQRLVVRDSIWRCSDGQCVAGSSPTRHASVCAGLAKNVGALQRFAVNGVEFSSDQLASCNRSAR